ncbi:MAG: LamB/YcsF family protein [Chloroflexi bacterium]|nr:LamB/YcsF family protein [Chloroflexota bacterium]
MVARIDFNCDMGESFGAWKMGLDEEVIKHVTSSNIACGFHAGDPVWMEHTVELARAHGVAIGAHPSYPDLMGFGRRDMAASPGDVKSYVKYQVGALRGFLEGGKLQHVKAHGALYNAAIKDDDLARAICQAVLEIDPQIILVVLAGTRWVEIAREMGNRVARETFADRAFSPDGTLAPRSQPGAVLHDPDQVVERSLRMIIEGTVTATDGRDIPIEADTICLHGDNPGAVELAAAIRSKFEEEGVEVVPMGTFC